AAAMAASAAALVKGFAGFDPAVRIVAVVCNRVAGSRHFDHLAPAIRRHTRVEPAGWLPRQAEWRIPERHLGLVTRGDLGEGGLDVAGLAAALEATVDVDLLLERSACTPIAAAPLPALVSPRPRQRRVAIARDAAFCFY